MKKVFLLLTIVIAAAIGVSAQKNVTPAIDRDPVMEADAKHNLDVAWQAFAPAKKAYKAVLGRFDETFVAYPEFSKMDEFLYLAGMSSYYLSINKGKQKIDLKSEKEKERFAPDRLRQDADTYLHMLIDKYPQSKYVNDAKKTLDDLSAVQTGSAK